MRYFLIGHKSSGKSTLGRQMAKRMNLRFIDLDEEIEKHEGKSIPRLYTELGDEGFRMKESRALKEVVKNDDVVIALGGGTPCHFDNMNFIKKNGVTIYLQIDDDTLVARLKSATASRPIVLNKSDEELRLYVRDNRNRCEAYYLQAHYIVNGNNLTADKLVEIVGRSST